MFLIKNRTEAGHNLGQKMLPKKYKNVCVLALPRGGVPVGKEIAKSLNAPFDILLVKKIGAPGHPEFAIGAVAEGEAPLWNQEVVRQLQLSDKQKKQLAATSEELIRVQAQKWRDARENIALEGRTVIVADDGLATGATMMAALHFLKRSKASKIIVAVPIASQSASKMIEELADELVVLETPEPFFSVGQWYEDFSEVTDVDVIEFLGSDATDFKE